MFSNHSNADFALVHSIDKVWIAEEKEKKEAQRLLELKKQLEDERAIEELRRVQAAAGLIT